VVVDPATPGDVGVGPARRRGRRRRLVSAGPRAAGRSPHV